MVKKNLEHTYHSDANIEQLNMFTECHVNEENAFLVQAKKFTLPYEGNLSLLVSLGFVENIQCTEHEQLLAVPEYHNIFRVSDSRNTNEV